MAFIFDLDGTLLDSMKIWDTAGSSFLKSRGIQAEEGLDARFKTFTLEEVAQYYRQVYHLPQSVEALMAEVNDFILEEYRHNAPPKAGVLAFLQAHQGAKMCIATATDRHLVELSLEIHGISGYFSQIFTCGEVGQGKTKPDIYLAALAHLGTKQEETWVVEDAYHGIFTAKQAGFPVIAVADPSAWEEAEEIRKLADVYVENLLEWEEKG